MAKKSTSNKKRLVKVEAVGQAHVHSSFNNIIISLTNSSGQVISWSSAGKMGFRGSKKNTLMQPRLQLPIVVKLLSIWE
jgi:small subunit ribosomal protein S11